MTRLARRTSLFVLLAAPLFAPGSLAAQQERAEPLPAGVAGAVIDFWNDPRRDRFHGPTMVVGDSVISGDIAVLDGPLEVDGRVEGSILMINGDVFLGTGAVVTGDLLVVGGDVQGLEQARIGGEILRYPGRLRYRLDGERMIRSEGGGAIASTTSEPEPRPGTRPIAPRREAELDFLVTTGNSYNRVEGLPITLGPRFRTSGHNPLHVHALAIFRTESGFRLDLSRLGYYVRAEQFIGARDEWRAGATIHSVVDPIEDWHVSDLENGLATFLFHQDMRDHYEREGISAFTTFEPRLSPLSITGEVRWENHRSLPAGSPLTLFENAEPWRAQPLVGDGRLGSVRLQASFDTRSETVDPSTGWYARGVVEQGFHAELTRPEAFHLSDGSADPATAPAEGFGRFTTGFADVRRYNRLSPDVRLNLRALIGGSLTGSVLPPQRQHAFGGEGSLPGYSMYSQDCGARDVVLRVSPDPLAEGARVHPYYGCDAFGLVQAELRGRADFRFRLDSAPWDDDQDDAGFGWDIAPDWVLFVNAGTGWAFDDRPDERIRGDAGAGLLIDRLGLFVAVPLDGSGRANVFVRLGSRF